MNFKKNQMDVLLARGLKQEVQDLRRQLDAYEGQNGRDNVVNSEWTVHTCTAIDTLQCSYY